MNKIAVALVDPKYEVNIGQVARVSANFGIDQLFLVDLRVDLEQSRKYASHGATLLDNAKVSSFSDLVEKFDYLVGTTAILSSRPSNILRTAATPSMLKNRLNNFKGSVCIIFGRNTTGLRNEELEACDIVVSIPTGTDYCTLNVAHSVAITLYELSKEKVKRRVKIAPRRYRERVIKYSIELANLSKIPQYRIPLLEKAMKNLVNRGGATYREITLLMGLIRKATLAVQRSEKKSNNS